MAEYASLVLSVDSTQMAKAAGVERDFAAAAREAEAAQKSAEKAEQSRKATIDDVIKSLQREVDLHGKSREEVIAYDIATKGATSSETMMAVALARKSKELDDATRNEEELTKATHAATKAQAATRHEIDGVIKALERDVALHGKSRAEILEYDMALRGATADERKHAASLLAKAEALQVADNKTSIYSRSVGFLKSQIGLLAGAMSVGFFANWIVGAIEGADAMDELAEAAGLTAEEYAKMNKAIKVGAANGVDVTMTMKMVNTAIVSNSDAFKQLGIQTVDASGKFRSAYDVTLDVADAFASMTDNTLKASLAADMFGRSGTQMVPLMNLGAAGVKALGENADVASKKLMALSAENEIGMSNLVGVTNSFRNALAEKLLPRLNDFIEWAVKFGPTLKPVLEVLGFLSGIITGPLTFALKSIMTSLTVVMGALTALGQAIATTMAVADRALHLDWDGAKAAAKAGGDAMVATAAGTGAQLIALWGDDEKAASEHTKKMEVAMKPVTMPVASVSVGGPVGTLDVSTGKVTTEEATDTRLAKELATEAEYAALRKAAALEEADFQTELATSRIADAARYREEDLAAEHAAQDAKRKMFAEGNSSIGRLLEQAGQKSKSLAKAALVWQKANALAQIAIDTPKAAMAAASAVAMIPLVGPALAGIASAAMYALGGAAAASVMSGGGGGGGAGVSIPNTSTGTGVLSPVGGTVADTGTAPARVAAIDFTITGKGMPSWEQLGEIMNMIGEKMADSGGRMGQVRIVTSDH